MYHGTCLDNAGTFFNWFGDQFKQLRFGEGEYNVEQCQFLWFFFFFSFTF